MISNFCCEPPCVSVLWDTYTVSVLWDTYTVSVLWEPDWPGEQKINIYFLPRHIWPTPSKAKGARKGDQKRIKSWAATHPMAKWAAKMGSKGTQTDPKGCHEEPKKLRLARTETVTCHGLGAQSVCHQESGPHRNRDVSRSRCAVGVPPRERPAPKP